ncbi:hypothetical protein SNOG_08362 [Parastagonospora nodorum SN15]|uniref:Uncharacterized protein n=1 Tax=Phaeosphaeria nodorum (strain SN15 / ATCC MYA-4574 / FGSC 10173) TaxID=321614 RepID=Q0UIQ2_PHANO|nr:hypothetical protein SNOG_08362 [Parastagonospora nodorum SN15]EAT84638.1 hypothetical protein SNOG_08362 [Parastagonospora nodorum SN15]
MDARQQEYPQSGLSSPYPTFPEPASEGVSVDQASAAQYPSQGQDPRASNLTPTSDYSLNPSSARSGSFPDYIQRSYQPGAQGQAPGGMAQQQSPSMPLSDGQANDHHQQQQHKSDSDVPIDPSIAAATSPTYSHQQQYSPYTPHHDMQHYPGHPQTPIYPSRPEWAGQYPQPGMHYGHPASSGPPAPAMVSPVQRPPTGGHPLFHCLLFSFLFQVRNSTRGHAGRYEEIERMYKLRLEWIVRRPYGTLNHLNAHADDERHRADAQQRHEGPPGEAPVYGQMRQAVGVPGQGPQHAQLPPIGYQPAASGNNAPPQYGTQSPGLPSEGMAQYATPNSHAYNSPNSNSSSYPQSPYGQNPQMYQQGH